MALKGNQGPSTVPKTLCYTFSKTDLTNEKKDPSLPLESSTPIYTIVTNIPKL